MKLDYAPGRVSISERANSAEIRVLVSELSVAARHCAISEAAIMRTIQPKDRCVEILSVSPVTSRATRVLIIH